MARIIRTAIEIDAADVFRTLVHEPSVESFPEAKYRTRYGATLYVGGNDVELSFSRGFETVEQIVARIDNLAAGLAAIRAEVVAKAAESQAVPA